MTDTFKIAYQPLPANFGPLKSANAHARITGPCGDTMEFWLRIENERILQTKFTTDGCRTSILSGSAAATLAEGKSLDEARRLAQADVLKATGEQHDEHCALLAVNTLHAAIGRFQTGAKTSIPEALQAPCGTPARPGSAPASPKAAPASPPPNPRDEPGLKARLQSIRHKVLVLSGKGGVGKSTVAANLAMALAMTGRRVGLLDVDIHGPSIPKLLGLEGRRPAADAQGIQPLVLGPNLKVMSIGFLIENARDAVIWRGPVKYNVIQQMLRDVAWGELDYLIIDSPPGTGDEPLTVAQLLGPPAAAIVVTTPQEVAIADVRRSVTFCEKLSLKLLGVVENMSGFVCPHCGQTTDLFKTGGGEALAREMKVPFLGRVPLDPQVVVSGDAGTPFVRHFASGAAARAFEEILRPILDLDTPAEEAS